MKCINYLRGTTKVTAKELPEDVINRVSAENILFWGAVGTENGTEFYIHTKNVRKILALYPDAEITGRGLPAKLRRLRGRVMLILTALILASLWFVSGQLLWEFDVYGNEKVSDFEILTALRQNGVTYGTLGLSVESEKLSNVMLCEIPELSWFAVNVNGSHAGVLVRERVPVPEIVDPKELVNVYAEKSGKVVSCEVYDGTRLVGVGDEVKAGDMLVSGITASYTGVREEHALARIFAEVDYEFSADMPKTCSFKAYTGRKEKKTSLEVCGRRFCIYLDGRSDFENYDTAAVRKSAELFGAVLPVNVVTEEFCEFEPQITELSAEQCGEILKRELSDKLRRETSGDVLSVSFEVLDEGDVVSVTMKAKVKERIA